MSRTGGVLVFFLSACGGSSDPLHLDGSVATYDMATATGSGVDAAGTDASGPEDLATTGTHDYNSPGPSLYTTVSLTVGTYDVSVDIPSSTGAHPVVYLEAGLLQNADSYLAYGQRLASWGIVCIRRSDPGISANAGNVATDVSSLVTTWLPAQNASSASPLFGLVNVTKVGLAGHSRGGQIVAYAAAGGLKGKIKGLFGIDPVDSGANAAATGLSAIGVPTAFLGETTSTSCAPTANNYTVFYAAAPSPSVAITSINGGHALFENDSSTCTGCFFCTAGSADPAAVLAYSVRYVTAFFARELLGDTSVGAAFDGSGASGDIASGKISVVSK